MRALLDINVLIALLDSSHIHHAPVTRWLSANLDAGWASCPITQNGCIRILSQPAYPNAVPVAQVATGVQPAMLGRPLMVVPAVTAASVVPVTHP